MEQVCGISFHFRCPERLHYSLDPAFFPSLLAQCTEEFLVGDSVGDARWAQPACPTQPTKQHPLLPLMGHRNPAHPTPALQKRNHEKEEKLSSCWNGAVPPLQEMVTDVAQSGNRIKDGIGKWTLNFANTGLPFSCSQALSLGGTVHHFMPSPNSSLLCPFPGLDVLLVNIVFCCSSPLTAPHFTDFIVEYNERLIQQILGVGAWLEFLLSNSTYLRLPCEAI